MKICLAASAGGHLIQLLRLREAYAPYPHFFLTTHRATARLPDDGPPVFAVGDANRRHPLRLARILVRVVRVLVRERPAVVLSTGAAVGCLASLVGRLLGARVVWVDSLANTERLSLSGRIARHVADLTLTQWPEVASEETGVECVGSLL